jgi:hypothetical protein
MNALIESALVVLIPEAETLVEPFRKRFDPSAAMGVPAHVTILYPFKPPDELNDDVFYVLRDLFRELNSFDTSFKDVRRFPDAFYLSPEPAEPFRQMTKLIANRFPDTPPYRGAFTNIIPHLTVAQISDPQQLDEVAAEFHETALDKLPIHARVNTVSLLENSNSWWQVRTQFSLHQDKQAS